MKIKLFLIANVFMFGINYAIAQPPSPQPQNNVENLEGGIMSGIDMNNTETSFVLNVNPMNDEKKEKLNMLASRFRNRDRMVLAGLGISMAASSTNAIINVVSTEIINLMHLRSKQKKTWQAMRQKECVFLDSLQSVRGQSDFYGKQSNYGPLDPSDMNFDGFTLCANRGGKEVLKMVCHIDTTKFDHLFLHSKFYLVVDTLVFHPYRSFLPNLNVNRIQKPLLKKDYESAKRDATRKVDKKKYWASQDELDYWNTISQFSYDEYQTPSVNIKMDVYSSWINELVQVYQDVKLGTFSVNIPIRENELKDSVYTYYRENSIARHRPTISIDGDCFVVPRSYMPVSANNPSWGTGEYKMKVVLSENCRYNPNSKRSKKWHRDYKQLVKMQNNGRAKNEYWDDVVTTFRDNKYTILKATYTPALNSISSMISTISTTGGGSAPTSSGMSSGGMKQGK